MNKIKLIKKVYSEVKDGAIYSYKAGIHTKGESKQEPPFVRSEVMVFTPEFPQVMRIPIKDSDVLLIKTIVHVDGVQGFLSTEGQFYPEALKFNDDVIELSFENRSTFAGRKIRKKGATEEFSILGCNLDHIFICTGKVSFEDAFNDYEFVNGEIFGKLK